MENTDLIYPDERGLNPYSLFCEDCGNYKYFWYTKIMTGMITFEKNGTMMYDIIDSGYKQLSNKEKVAAILEKHIITGNQNIEQSSTQIRCGKCYSDNVVLYGDMLAECYQNHCVGCFKCGGAFNDENIERYCVQCVLLRKQYADKDNSLFWLTLDMDLFCDSCPIKEVRESYNIDGERIRKKVCGKL
ncbi:MAG: hypothetical protein WCY30_07230 [Candidatus Neomarinimicrobiota bacterium]|jgi:hypothetical protein